MKGITGRSGAALVRQLAVVASIVVMAAIQPHPAWADSVKVTPVLQGAAGYNPISCIYEVRVLTQASFDRGVQYDDAKLEFGDPGGGLKAPAGRVEFHYPNGAKADFVTWYLDASIKPGIYPMKVTWSAKTGNGLSVGYGVAEAELLVQEREGVGKLSGKTKCEMARLSRIHAKTAAKINTAAKLTKASCADCYEALRSVAAEYFGQSVETDDIANDPPDPNFTTLPTPVAPVPLTVAAGQGITAEASTAVNDLLRLLSDVSGASRGALSALERAMGAHKAGDETWEERQATAAAAFLKDMATRLAQLPGAMQTAGARLKAGGFANPAIDRKAVDAGIADLFAEGPTSPSSSPNWLREQGGLSDADLKKLPSMLALANDEAIGSAPLLDPFSPPGFAAAVAATVAALNAAAAELTANPQITYTYDNQPIPSSSPSPSPSKPRPTAAAEGASLLSNSGFESPALSTGISFETLLAGKPRSLAGWTLQKGSIDLVKDGALAATGGQFIDLNGNDTKAGPGTIGQDITVTPGHLYRLSFQLAGNPNGTPPVKDLKVNLGDREQKFSFDIKGHTNNDLGWTTHTMDYCGQDDKVTVIFTSLTEGIRGPNLDNIALTELGRGSCSSFPIWLIVLASLIVVVAAAAAIIYFRRRRSQPSLTPGNDLPAAESLTAA